MRAATDADIVLDNEIETPEAAAVDWHVKVASGRMSRADDARFSAWLRRRPENAEAYARIAAIWDGMEPLADSNIVQEGLLEARRLKARSATGLGGFLSGAWRAFGAPAAIAAVFMIVAAATMIALQVRPFGDDVHRTAVGEQREIKLADGSTIMLNTATVIDVDYSADERRVTLLDGQASFDVARDPERAFVVDTGGALVRALGTQFDIYKSSDAVTVTLIEGKVEVAAATQGKEEEPDKAAPAAPFARAELSPGEQVEIASRGALSPVARIDVGRVVAWREGKVSFRDTPLAEAVAEMNRYSATKITLADGDLAELRVSGVFRVGNSDHFVSALESLLDVKAKDGRDEIVLSRPASG